MTALPDIPLPAGIRSRTIDGINGLRMHVLEAGFETKGRRCILLLHGFPELAFSWRKMMPALADAGYHVIAPDQHGYGRTTGWSAEYDGDLAPFSLFNLVRDALALVSAFGYRPVDVVGHDFGSPVSAWCALIRPDVFRSVTMMSAPFGGPPPLPFGTVDMPAKPAKPAAEDPVHRELAALPRPRKHYQWYYSTREANADMHRAPQGVHDFLHAYYHHKSADWTDNKPYPLQSWSAHELAKLPTYYVMDLNETMAETVAKEMPSPAAVAANHWLPDRDLAYYSAEYGRTGFQGGLAMVSLRHVGRLQQRAAIVCRPQYRRALLLHLGQAGLGHLSAPGRVRDDAEKRMHEDARLPSRRRRRPLGPAGAAGRGHPIAAGLPHQDWPRLI
ncbi:pimeloyl-ACP methyl ester carboxylesterase [Bradyrhizobium liaoningense]